MAEPSCANCKLRAYAERKPDSIWAKLWKWHTGWCPGWKSYQRYLAEQEHPLAEEQEPEDEHDEHA